MENKLQLDDISLGKDLVAIPYVDEDKNLIGAVLMEYSHTLHCYKDITEDLRISNPKAFERYMNRVKIEAAEMVNPFAEKENEEFQRGKEMNHV